ncbi:hypothetical protein EDB85DRAFT_1897060 [Lactarius pseudohatsudake]|nr:hypothetical protein EDB85DRAFT_1897060 [Lactarius pseudohatsudake]
MAHPDPGLTRQDSEDGELVDEWTPEPAPGRKQNYQTVALLDSTVLLMCTWIPPLQSLATSLFLIEASIFAILKGLQFCVLRFDHNDLKTLEDGVLLSVETERRKRRGPLTR